MGIPDRAILGSSGLDPRNTVCAHCPRLHLQKLSKKEFDAELYRYLRDFGFVDRVEKVHF